MKNSKRILGIALAIIMIFNVFAIGTFAAFPDDALVKLSLSSEKTVFAPGEEIELKFSVQCSDKIKDMMIGGGYEIAYNSAVIEPYSTSGDMEDHGYTAIQAGDQIGISVVTVPSTEPSPLYDWDTSILYTLVDSDVTFDATEETDLFTLKMKVKADAPYGTYTIGFNPAGYEAWAGYINDGLGLGGIFEGWTNFEAGYEADHAFEYGTFTFTVGAGKIIFHEKAQHNTKLTTTEKATLGFVGEFDSADIGGFQFEENGTTLANVTAVGVTLDIAGIGSKTYTTDTVYTKGGTDYNYRAILKDLDLTQYGDAEIKATYFITFLKDGEETTEYSDVTEGLTANGIING